ncbi:protein YgfX [Duganella fentianensis]|uniref:protein YgfX n=1 Tax=Duganella fentianensis TaxID=2692177 RepID=UPI0032B2572A
MSIAASVVLRPSVCLRWLCCAMRCAVCLTALAAPEQGWSLLCVVLAAGARRQPECGLQQLDISAGGQWYLSVYQKTAQSTLQKAALNTATQGSMPACVAVRTTVTPHAHYLLAGSLIWPSLLLLHLGVAGQHGRYLLVLPDSVSAADWRALMLASRALAARGGSK